jgi:UDPglucose--hexose-1-phosphate uridylyltransferase
MITFEKTVKYSRILNPLKNFEEDVVTFEYRTDPLTGRNTTVIKGMLKYVSKFLGSDEKLLNSLVEKTRMNCPFCPESVKEKTPMFTQDFLKEGRIFVGDAVVIPNLLGHAERSILVVLSKEHYLKLKDFTPKLIFDGFKGGLTYLKRLNEVEPSIRFPVFIFNYLPPAGSSIFHPHMQVLVRDRPFYLAKLLLEKSKAYYENNESSYWSDLISKERAGERYLFEIKDVEWFVPFAPLRGANEVQAIVRGKSNLLELNDKEWLGLAEGISKILQFYHKEGYVSFNIILASGPMDQHLDYFDVNLRIISRPGIQASNFTDAWALPYLLWDGEAIEEPELFAERITKFIRATGMSKL